MSFPSRKVWFPIGKLLETMKISFGDTETDHFQTI